MVHSLVTHPPVQIVPRRIVSVRLFYQTRDIRKQLLPTALHQDPATSRRAWEFFYPQSTSGLALGIHTCQKPKEAVESIIVLVC